MDKMFNANKFTPEKSFIRRGNTTHWFGRGTVTRRFARQAEEVLTRHAGNSTSEKNFKQG